MTQTLLSVRLEKLGENLVYGHFWVSSWADYITNVLPPLSLSPRPSLPFPRPRGLTAVNPQPYRRDNISLTPTEARVDLKATW